MGKFRKSELGESKISTSSLPDIVFLLLFFFMVTATIKTQDELVDYQVPSAQNLTKPEKKFLIKELTVGFPKSGIFGKVARISDGTRFIQVDDIPQWAAKAKEEFPENYRDKMIVLLKADLDVNMGLVADIQEKLREANARKILYRSNEELN
jgi:biopolymer transport protein ExbD